MQAAPLSPILSSPGRDMRWGQQVRDRQGRRGIEVFFPWAQVPWAVPGCLVLALEDAWGGLLGEAAVRVAGLGEATPLDGEVAFLQVYACNAWLLCCSCD